MIYVFFFCILKNIDNIIVETYNLKATVNNNVWIPELLYPRDFYLERLWASREEN